MADPRKKQRLMMFPPMQTFPTNIVSIAAGGITASSFAAGAINAAAIAANAITSAKIAAGAITLAAFAANAIDATVLAANAVGASQFTQGAADKVWASATRTVTGTVTVGTNNDKTAYSLTAGSYSVRASSNQQGTISLTTTLSATTGISSVTLTRAKMSGAGANNTNSGGGGLAPQDIATVTLQASTVTLSGGIAGGNTKVAGFCVEELF